MSYNYSAPTGENAAKSVGISLGISTKKSIEICNTIRGKTLVKAKKILTEAIALKRPIPHTRFNKDTGHKHGMAAGRFAAVACKGVLSIIESAEANAQFKGLNTNNLIVKHISAQQGPTSWHYGRQKRREAKRTHIEVILEETKQAPEKKTRERTQQKPKQNTVLQGTEKVKVEQKKTVHAEQSSSGRREGEAKND